MMVLSWWFMMPNESLLVIYQWYVCSSFYNTSAGHPTSQFKWRASLISLGLIIWLVVGNTVAGCRPYIRTRGGCCTLLLFSATGFVVAPHVETIRPHVSWCPCVPVSMRALAHELLVPLTAGWNGFATRVPSRVSSTTQVFVTESATKYATAGETHSRQLDLPLQHETCMANREYLDGYYQWISKTTG